MIPRHYPAATVRRRHRTDKREAQPVSLRFRAFHKQVRPSLPHFLVAEASLNEQVFIVATLPRCYQKKGRLV
jgi:hypothetical protein